MTRRVTRMTMIFFLLAGLTAGCGPESATHTPAGDIARGERAIEIAGCGSCHAIPGIDSANGRVGPPLHNLARRAYLAGVLPNNFTNLVRWIQHPRDISPGTAMPDTGLDQRTAEDIAAYLYHMEP